MWEVYDGDFLLFTTDDKDEADYFRIEGYIVRQI